MMNLLKMSILITWLHLIVSCKGGSSSVKSVEGKTKVTNSTSSVQTSEAIQATISQNDYKILSISLANLSDEGRRFVALETINFKISISKAITGFTEKATIVLSFSFGLSDRTATCSLDQNDTTSLICSYVVSDSDTTNTLIVIQSIKYIFSDGTSTLITSLDSSLQEGITLNFTIASPSSLSTSSDSLSTSSDSLSTSSEQTSEDTISQNDYKILSISLANSSDEGRSFLALETINFKISISKAITGFTEQGATIVLSFSFGLADRTATCSPDQNDTTSLICSYVVSDSDTTNTLIVIQSIKYIFSDSTSTLITSLDSSLDQGTTLNFTIANLRLVFGQEPTSALAGATISPGVIVQIEDGNGNIVSSRTTNVTLSIGNNPNSGSLSGTLTQMTSNGVASFNDLSIDQPGSFYTLLARASDGTTQIDSESFNVTANFAMIGPSAPISSSCAKYTFGFLDSHESFVKSPALATINLDSRAYFVGLDDTAFCSPTLGTKATELIINKGESYKELYLRPQSESNLKLDFTTSDLWARSPIFSSSPITVNLSPAASGILDSTIGYSTYGYTTTVPDPAHPDYTQSYFIGSQSDGKYIVGGFINTQSGLVRYNNDGTLDTTFGTNGVSSTVFVGDNVTDYDYDELYSLNVQSDDKIVMLGLVGYDHRSYTDIFLLRFNADGSLDTSFGSGGVVLTFPTGDYTVWAYPTSLEILSNGKFLVYCDLADYDIDYVSRPTLIRYNSDGSLDSSFGTNGILSAVIGSGDSYAGAMKIQDDGRIVTLGYTPSGLDEEEPEYFSSYVCLKRFLADGSVDATFGESCFPKTGEDRNSLMLSSSGKIIVSGDSSVKQFNSDGGLDLSFGTNGTVFLGRPIAPPIPQSDGKILVLGPSSDSGSTSFLARLNSNGQLDSSFGRSGTIIPDFNGLQGWMYHAIVQDDGKIVGTGTIYPANLFMIARFSANGDLDPSFGATTRIDGRVSTIISGDWNKEEVANGIIEQKDSKLVLAGKSSLNFALARYNSDGTLDSSFNNSGFVLNKIGDKNEFYDVVEQPDGKLLAAGYIYHNTSSTKDVALARYSIWSSSIITYKILHTID